ncbi:MAG: anthranilate synthase component I family protein [Actinomycetota bacterium]|nr:anthranilate synthase component I family protein [Actinomycetota bacterium]
MTTVSAQWVDPESVLAAVTATHDRVFWLDGGGSRDWAGRLSYLGWLEPGEPSLVHDAATRTVVECDGHSERVVGEDIFEVLDRRTTAPEGRGGFGGWVGYLGYACRPDLPARVDPDGPPDAVWMRVGRYAVFDHVHRTVRLHGIESLPSSPLPCTGDLPAVTAVGPSYDDYRAAFDRVQAELRAGNSYETNLTYRVEVTSAADPVAVYLRLRRLNRAPYAAFLRHRGVSLLSSSPERFVTIGPGGVIETRPIKGTTERSDDPAVDRRNRDLLRTDPKFRAENLMVVDLLRNDLSTVCEVGSVVVPDLMHVESYPRVHQLVTTIRGRLRADVSGVRAVQSLFPGGSMTGAPKLRTMQIIGEVETSARGVYSGALGWIGDDGRADLGVVIRTLVHRGSAYSLGTGGAITVRSDPKEEYAESRWKAERLLGALTGT